MVSYEIDRRQAQLDIATRELNPTTPSGKRRSQLLDRLVTEDSSFLTLYIATAREPIVIRDAEIVTVGRCNIADHSIHSTVDLSDHQAALLGVSRFHAEITYDGHYHYVRDLDSTNGTWLNDERLSTNKKVVLTDGDILRLGHFVITIGIHAIYV